MQFRQDFDDYYKSTIEGKLDALESERKELIQRTRDTRIKHVIILISVLLLVTLLIIVMRFPLAPFIHVLLGFLYLLFLIGDISYMVSLNRDTGTAFIRKYKEMVIKEMVSFFYSDLNYFPDKYIDSDDFRSSGLFPGSIEEYSGDDLFQGKSGKTNIQFSGLEFFITRKFCFSGIFLIADFNKNFKTSVYIMPDFGEKTGTGHLGVKFLYIEFPNIKKKNLVKLEDRQFEKEFAVYSKDQVEARYVLTPMLMQKILDFNKQTRRGIFLSFSKSRINIAVPLGNIFEPPFRRPVTDYDYIKKNYYYLSLFAEIVEELDLNTRIWGKK